MRPKSRMRTSRRVYGRAAVMLAIPATAVALTARPSTGGTARRRPDRHHERDQGQPHPAPCRLRQERDDGGRSPPAQPSEGSSFGPPRSAATPGASSPRRRAPRRQLPDDHPDASVRQAAGRQRARGRRAPRSEVTVAAHRAASSDSVDVLAGQPSPVRGKLLPAISGRKVRLEGRQSDGSWHLLSTDRTGSRGGFGLSYAGGDASKLRVHFTGDRQNTRAASPPAT